MAVGGIVAGVPRRGPDTPGHQHSMLLLASLFAEDAAAVPGAPPAGGLWGAATKNKGEAARPVLSEQKPAHAKQLAEPYLGERCREG